MPLLLIYKKSELAGRNLVQIRPKHCDNITSPCDHHLPQESHVFT